MTRRDHPELVVPCRVCLAMEGEWCRSSTGLLWRRSHRPRHAAYRRLYRRVLAR